MKYELVVRDGMRSMEEAVNEMLEEGWKLQGGVSISEDSNTLCYCQAMIKHDDVNINIRASKKVNTISLRDFLEVR